MKNFKFQIKKEGLATLIAAVLAPSVLAAATQEEVFKSISNSVDSSVDPRAMIAVCALVVGVIIILAFVKMRGEREVSAKAFNHPGRLVKEIAKQVNLRPTEIKQLKLLAESQDVNPLTLMLCPSLLSKAIKNGVPKLDKAVVAGLIKKVSNRPSN